MAKLELATYKVMAVTQIERDKTVRVELRKLGYPSVTDPYITLEGIDIAEAPAIDDHYTLSLSYQADKPGHADFYTDKGVFYIRSMPEWDEALSTGQEGTYGPDEEDDTDSDPLGLLAINPVTQYVRYQELGTRPVTAEEYPTLHDFRKHIDPSHRGSTQRESKTARHPWRGTSGIDDAKG